MKGVSINESSFWEGSGVSSHSPSVLADLPCMLMGGASSELMSEYFSCSDLKGIADLMFCSFLPLLLWIFIVLDHVNSKFELLK